MSDDLRQLRHQVAGKQALEAKRAELECQRAQYQSCVWDLDAIYRKEQSEVDRLEGRSLANYFFTIVGKLDEKLDKERREACAAKVKLDAAQQELAGIEADAGEIRSRLAQLRAAEVRYAEELERKRTALKASGSETADQILTMEDRIANLEAQKREIREAICAGQSALDTAGRILSELDSADGWNTWDMLGGSGIITHLAKHEHLDAAQDLVSQLQGELRRFKTELADIRIRADLQVNIDGFLRFADYFFDGLFADWAVADKISQSITSVRSTKAQIERTLEQLRSMESETEGEIAKRRQLLDDLIVEA